MHLEHVAEKTKKVFCRNCKYFYEDKSSFDCFHPYNIEIVDTWLEKKEVLIKSPDAINMDNNCKWFEPKEVHASKEVHDLKSQQVHDYNFKKAYDQFVGSLKRKVKVEDGFEEDENYDVPKKEIKYPQYKTLADIPEVLGVFLKDGEMFIVVEEVNKEFEEDIQSFDPGIPWYYREAEGKNPVDVAPPHSTILFLAAF